MHPDALKTTLASGLLSFPVTDFDASGAFRPDAYARRLQWLASYGVSALFVAGGTGEFFSLAADEYAGVVRTAAETCRGQVPIVAGAGGPTRVAAAYASEAERLGASGILLLPHYLTEAPQEGLAAYVEAVCRATTLGVVVYNRGLFRMTAETLAGVADRCPNLVGFKDGLGEIELMVAIRRRMGDRLAYLGGLPTAEISAAAYRAIGVPVYSSAVFNFVPRTALQFSEALARGDRATTDALLDDFFLPLLGIRSRRAGYAVSLVKAGARLVGRGAGPVRPPLTDLLPDEVAALDALIRRLGPQ